MCNVFTFSFYIYLQVSFTVSFRNQLKFDFYLLLKLKVRNELIKLQNSTDNRKQL